ncbi:class I SAM-dependent methyltransferase [Paenibacillus sp. J2TS4]|uniref:class I SAM-dependent methyltransferase n=1 Tax=Paenibacillus sp. J2TS4 TaxID=2807194 RepID=UPI001B103544|nr:class I SAM-dependent methyltransferase [Paenibacillus sp. J2TS4]GIP35052.1 SAM-dependent methyltransferase [Paenibacillus sp. J2TS4]
MHERRFNPANLERLDNPERRKTLPPEQILRLLPVQPEDTILDAGAGSGYFTIPAARMTEGVVYALDVEPQMLEVLKSRVEEQGLTNVERKEGPLEAIPFADGCVDHVIASMVLHEAEPFTQGAAEISRVLKPGGHLLCLEWEHKVTESGPPPSHRIPSEQMEEALKEAGLEVVHRENPSDAIYLLVARKQ